MRADERWAVCLCCGLRSWSDEREASGEHACECEDEQWGSPAEMELLGAVADARWGAA